MVRQVILPFLLAFSIWTTNWLAGTALAATSLTVNGSAVAVTVAPGASVTVGVVSGSGLATDWLGFYPTGGTVGVAPWVYVNGNLTFTAPATSGTYEFRLYDYNATVLRAVSPTVTVSGVPIPPPPPPPPLPLPPPPPPPPVTGAPVVTVVATPSYSITVTMTGGPGTSVKTWLGLFAVGAANTAYLDWFRLNGLKTDPAAPMTTGRATFIVPSTGGPYEVRLLTSPAPFLTLATGACPITVTAVPTTTP